MVGPGETEKVTINLGPVDLGQIDLLVQEGFYSNRRVWRQVIEATPWGRTPRHLLRDHDAVYGRDFRARAERIGIEAIATPVASLRANAVVERLIRTLRRECMDQLIILDEQHLRSVLTDFVQYYNLERPHRTLRRETPVPARRAVEGLVRSRPVLGGLCHVYERVA